ncbi:hypothetical protein AVBRAN_1371 [Campylobacter sp. RM12651]|nr:hypothetical protein AVBRAN_1371 [Campylobacter sp. RM12651]
MEFFTHTTSVVLGINLNKPIWGEKPQWVIILLKMSLFKFIFKEKKMANEILYFCFKVSVVTLATGLAFAKFCSWCIALAF